MTLGKNEADKEKEEEDPLEISDNKRHPLFERMENAKFFIMKVPNMESLYLAIKRNEWALTKSSAEKLTHS